MTISTQEYCNDNINLNTSQTSDMKNLWCMCNSPIYKSVECPGKESYLIRHFCEELYIVKEGNEFGFIKRDRMYHYRLLETIKDSKKEKS